MMKRLCAVMLLLVIVTPAWAEQIALYRGIGLHEWLNWSPLEADGSYRWPPYLTEEQWLAGARPITDWPPGDQFRNIRAMGFDFVRLSVDPGPLVSNDGEKRQQALAIVSGAVGKITAAGLKVVLDLHGVRQVPVYGMDMVQGGADSDGVARYRLMVRDVATMLLAFGSDQVALEPYNEPAYYPCDSSGSDDWQRIMAATVADIRSVSADMTIVVTGACGGSITGLTNLDPYFDDPNIYYSFHMYEPHSFTHQLPDDKQAFSSGLPWPAEMGSPAQVVANLKRHMDEAGLSPAQQNSNLAVMRSKIDEYFNENWGVPQMQARLGEAVAWADRNHISTRRLFMGEFGAFLISADGRSGAYDEDRLRYVAAARIEAERLGIVWSLWEYSNPHGLSLILPKGPAIPDPGLLKALGLL